MTITSITKSRSAFVFFLAVSIGAMFINTNILLSMRNILSKNQLRSLFHDEMHHVIQEYEALSLPEKVIQDSVPDDRLREWFDSMENKGQLETGDNINNVPYLFQKNFKPEYTMGKGRLKNVSVVIGIPSIKRPGGVSYLHETLQSFIDNMYPIKEDSVSIVVLLAETDMDYVYGTAERIYSKFSREIDNGLLQVISPPSHLYPNFRRLPQTFGDLPKRLQWRSKEVFDAAYLMFYCRNVAPYYLMMEDDVIASIGYIGALEKFAAIHKNNPYVYLSLADLSSIGKVFRTSDIPIWVTYFFNFYGDKPIDWLMNDFVTIKACNPEMDPTQCWMVKENLKPALSRGIFQHIGLRSSLDGKYQHLYDSSFTSHPASGNPHKNPDGKIESSFLYLNHTDPVSWYGDSGGMAKFLLVGESTFDDYLTVKYAEPIKVSKILVKTGCQDRSAMLTEGNGVLEAMTHDDQEEPFEKCGDFNANGQAECQINKYKIMALRIRVTDKQSIVFFRLIFVI